MKRILTIAAFVGAGFYSFAQDVNKLIRQDDVERIIKTLSADDMRGRATFTPDIERAAQFIESEYKQIGLKPMEGSTDYRQSFTMTRVTALKTLVTINGKLIAPDSVLASTSAAGLNWNNDGDVQVVKL